MSGENSKNSFVYEKALHMKQMKRIMKLSSFKPPNPLIIPFSPSLYSFLKYHIPEANIQQFSFISFCCVEWGKDGGLVSNQITTRLRFAGIQNIYVRLTHIAIPIHATPSSKLYQ